MPYSDREKKREWDRRYKELNKEKIREKKAEYYQLNKEKIRGQRAEYRKEARIKCREYLGGKCVKCGAIHNLQFDHIDRTTKKYTIASRVTNNFTILKEELNKCQLLCYDCHKIKTKSERTILCKMKPTQRGD